MRPPAGGPLAALAAALRAEGGLLARASADPDAAPRDPTPLGDLAAAGWAARGRPDPADAALVVEAVREGYLLHHTSRARVLRTEDPDLALLAGDRLYALGLARLADLGDLPAVAELAEVIALSSRAHAVHDAELADAVWVAGAAAVGFGSDAAHAEAKDRARAGDPSAAAALRAVARQLAGELASESPVGVGPAVGSPTLTER